MASWTASESPAPKCDSQVGSSRTAREVGSPWPFGGEVGYGGVQGGAGAFGAPYKRVGKLAVGPCRGIRHSGDQGGAGAIDAPSFAHGRAIWDRSDAEEIGGSFLETAAPATPRTRWESRISKTSLPEQ